MKRAALRLLDDPSMAEDIVQDSFLLFLTKYPEADRHTDYINWLVTVLKNKIANENSRAYHTRELPFPPGFDPSAEEATFSGFMAAMPEGLDDEEKKLLYLHLEAGLTHKEIAGQLGCSADACKMRLYRARIHCRNLLLAQKN